MTTPDLPRPRSPAALARPGGGASAVALALGLGLLVSVGASPAARAGTEVLRSERGLTYSLRVPGGHDPLAGALVVLGLHGQGGAHDQFVRVLEQAGYLARAVLVVPQAPADAAWQEADLDPVIDLVREVRARHRALRVIAFGYSRGAYFSFALALRAPEGIDAVIAHSGGLVAPIPAEPTARAVPFYVIHGDQDTVVPPDQSRDAVHRLRAAGFQRVEHDEVKGLPHRIDPAASQRGFGWVDKVLGPAAPRLTAAQANEAIAKVEKAVRGGDAAAAVEGFRDLGGCPGAVVAKAGKLAKKHADADDAEVALAALRCAAQLAQAGLPALAVGLKDARDPVAIEAARGLASVGGDPATELLIGGLASAEAKDRASLEQAIQTALTRVTGETQADAAAWKRWWAGRRRR